MDPDKTGKQGRGGVGEGGQHFFFRFCMFSSVCIIIHMSKNHVGG